MINEEIIIATADGDCPSYVFAPGDGATHPAVIFFMDGLGIRPVLHEMGQRLASHGYVVLLPDLYYRDGPYEPINAAELFASGNVGAVLGKLTGATDNLRAAEDTRAFLDYLATRTDVSGAKIGTTGYCLGGGISLTVAGTYPDRVAAAASFHGGRLVTDAPTSPSLVASAIEARVYVAGADYDEGYPPEMAEQLDEILTSAGVDHRLEVYTGARHGFTMSDFPVYDEEAAERHWRELLALLEDTLKPVG
jgi:carboxymethylenebutenolidase